MENIKNKELKEYEYICEECKGLGVTKKTRYIGCEKCGGKGKLDWIEKIKGINVCKYCKGLGYTSILTNFQEINIRGFIQKIPIGYNKVNCIHCEGTGFEQ